MRRLGAGVLVAFLLVPLLPLLLWAVAGDFRYPAVMPAFSDRGLRLLGEPAVRSAVGTSLLIALTVAVLATLIGAAAGRAIGLYAFPGRRGVQLLLLAPVIVPTLAVTLGIQVYFIRYGLADSVAGVVLVQLIPTVPYVSLVMAASFAGLDVDIEDAGRVLGAGPVRRLVHVTLPAVAPGLAVAALFAFLISWSEYILTLLIGGGTVRTLPLLLFALIGSADLTAAAALSLVIAAPPVLLVGLTARFLTGASPAVVGFGRL
ncbi:ABC transporter permease [Pseudonocardia abyssalis]|uniref:ABC transporter permease subunit n=1 Tax=Pseudonocardia abyssalis TaxID=2792008 RepID=A0ABS6USS0_9PSEU|nr:ABC transporter permease subunit [Pseudonocardia abyssalis]MBW0115659.1 ABC transporter permease subunit [Pseudonocardia abyssalis]MBW0134996.1 ABC transporter permease subunit [Pseudonocardia abyssalis]